MAALKSDVAADADLIGPDRGESENKGLNKDSVSRDPQDP